MVAGHAVALDLGFVLFVASEHFSLPMPLTLLVPTLLLQFAALLFQIGTTVASLLLVDFGRSALQWRPLVDRSFLILFVCGAVTFLAFSALLLPTVPSYASFQSFIAMKVSSSLHLIVFSHFCLALWTLVPLAAWSPLTLRVRAASTRRLPPCPTSGAPASRRPHLSRAHWRTRFRLRAPPSIFSPPIGHTCFAAC